MLIWKSVILDNWLLFLGPDTECCIICTVHFWLYLWLWKMDLQEVGCGGVDWIKLAQVRDRWQGLVTLVMNLWVP
jgi:hypothetical protein